MRRKNQSLKLIITLSLLITFLTESMAQHPGDIKTICQQTIPVGWVCINVGSLCNSADPYGGPGSYTRTIEYYEGLPPGSKINMSADVVPAGWVKTTLSLGPALPAIINGKVGTSIYYNSTIEKIEGLETSDSIITVDQITPDGWLGTNIGGLLVGATIFQTRPIVKIDKMNPNRTYKMASSVPPPGWLITGFTSTTQIGSSFYQLCIIQNHLNMPVGKHITAIDNGFYNGTVVPDGWTTDATGQITSFLNIYNTYTITKKQSRISGLINGGIWTKSGSPYVLTGTVNIPANNVLTIQPGVTAKFSNSSVNMIVDGSLSAQGTSKDSIHFKGTANSTSLRGGFVSLNSAGSVLKYVSIDSLGDAAYSNAAVNISDGITPTISNTTIKNSGTTDVYSSIDGVQKFSNFNGIIAIPGGGLSKDQSLLKISGNSSYKLLNDLTVPTGRILTVQPGVRISFPSFVSMYVNGKLNAQGSSADSIYFKGTATYGNYRGGIISLNSDSSTLNYVSIDSLGDAYYFYGTIQIAAKSIISNSTIKNSETAGIYSTVSGAKISACTITNNATGVLVVQGKPMLANNNIYGNKTFGINNTSNTDTVDATNTYWGTASGPYHPTLNPSGTGNKVSDRVKFIPWNGMQQLPLTFSAFSHSYLNNNSINHPSITIFPVPSKSIMHIIIQADRKYNTTVLLFDAAGKVVSSIKKQIQKGSNDISLNVSSLIAGQYILKVAGMEDFIKAQNVIVIH